MTETVARDDDIVANADEPIADLFELGRWFRRLGVARSRIREVEQTAQREHERIDQWVHDETESDRRQEQHCLSQIGLYALTRREGGDKSLTTPWGTVSTRQQPPEYVRDAEVLRQWAETHGFMRERVISEVNWAAIKERGVVQPGGVLAVDGEIVTGVVVRQREPSVEATPYE